jgi:CspA family cold shock protein
MALHYRLLICIIVASPLSALYNGWATTGSISYLFNVNAALAFTFTAILCVLLGNLTLFSSGSINNGHKEKTRPAKKGKTSGKGRQQGDVKWFNGSKGFGFISCDDGEEIFVHFRSLRKDSARLGPGKRVEFVVVDGKKGREAEDVTVI